MVDFFLCLLCLILKSQKDSIRTSRLFRISLKPSLHLHLSWCKQALMKPDINYIVITV